MPKGIKGFIKGNTTRNTGRTRFKKGKSSWNKGLHIPVAEETKKKLSLSLKGRKKSQETRKKMSEANKGDKCHFWKGGVAPQNKILRMSVEYKLWREAVFKRDNWTCIWCGFKGYVQADHIKPFALYPELRFSIDNGRTLCVDCHKTTHTFGGRTK